MLMDKGKEGWKEEEKEMKGKKKMIKKKEEMKKIGEG